MVSIAATFGDPTGIGPEVALKALRKFLNSHSNVKIHLFAPKALVPGLGKNLFIHDLETKPLAFRASCPSKASGARALFDLTHAIKFCLAKDAAALVTGPLDKFICAKTLSSFTGHTEYLGKLSRAKGTTMLLSGKTLTVALVTGHIALNEVSKKLTKAKIIETSLRTQAYLKTFKENPKLAILGLNPHASDRGLFGNEEKRVIEPAIAELKKRGLHVSGPFSPDSFFHRSKDFDAVICMYHDQALIPLKMLHFYDAVNITLGLPFLRVSVDHGTAFDIAGKGIASSLSYESALRTAYEFAKKA